MDPLTHVVVGRAVVAAVRDERRNLAIGAAAMLGALTPDADAILAFTGWDRYVRAHQFGTHSLVGALAMATLTTIVVERGAKAFARASPLEATERFGTLFAAAAAGAFSHLALDLISGARIAIGWPLVNRRVSLPLVAMADPWLIGISLIWIALLWPLRVHLRRASRAIVAVAAVFLGMKAVLFSVALQRSAVAPAEPSAIEARWGSLTDWTVFERSDHAVRASAISAVGGPPVVLLTQSLPADSPIVHASRNLEDVCNFLAVHEFAFPRETRGAASVSVMWSDLRYCWSTGCGVWVGGTFDSQGNPAGQEIRVGSLVQRRRN